MSSEHAGGRANSQGVQLVSNTLPAPERSLASETPTATISVATSATASRAETIETEIVQPNNDHTVRQPLIALHNSADNNNVQRQQQHITGSKRKSSHGSFPASSQNLGDPAPSQKDFTNRGDTCNEVLSKKCKIGVSESSNASEEMTNSATSSNGQRLESLKAGLISIWTAKTGPGPGASASSTSRATTTSPVTHKMKATPQTMSSEASPARALFQTSAPFFQSRSYPQHVHIGSLPHDVLLQVLRMVLDDPDTWPNLCTVCRSWHQMCSSKQLFAGLPRILVSSNHSAKAGSINWKLFRNMGLRYRGTEGTLCRCIDRQTGKELAFRRARVFPDADGVPYYMLRELAFMRRVHHPNIASLELVNLHHNQLHLFFEYVSTTLHTVLYPNADCEAGVRLPAHCIRSYMHQLLQALTYCHRRGLLHRNLKPKHILLTPTGGLKIADFALARLAQLPARPYTTQVVTLWYRAPEVILGGDYFSAIDIWSTGCIFAEMLFGTPTFMCAFETEVDHLFKIFRTLGTPTEKTWPGFGKLPYAVGQEFPQWPARPFTKVFPAASSFDPAAIDLLQRFLCLDPNRRMQTHDALQHPYFKKTLGVPAKDASSSKSPVAAENKIPTKNTTSVSELITKHQLLTLEQHEKLLYAGTTPDSNSFDASRKSSVYINHRCEDISAFTKVLKQAYKPKPVLSAAFLDTVNDTRSFAHSLRQVLLERLQADGRMGTLPMGIMTLQDDVYEGHRSMLVDWLVEVVEVFAMCGRTPFLAMNFVDKFLSQRKVPRKNFQLMGAACLHVASKCEDLSYIGVKELVECGDDTFTKKELLKMEEEILVEIDFQLAVATVYDFTQVFMKLFPIEACSYAMHLVNFLAEITLLDAKFCEMSPSLTAAAVYVYSHYVVHKKSPPANFMAFFFDGVNNYDYSRDRPNTRDELRHTVKALHTLHLNVPQSELVKIVERYEKPNFSSVSRRKAPALLTISW